MVKLKGKIYIYIHKCQFHRAISHHLFYLTVTLKIVSAIKPCFSWWIRHFYYNFGKLIFLTLMQTGNHKIKICKSDVVKDLFELKVLFAWKINWLVSPIDMLSATAIDIFHPWIELIIHFAKDICICWQFFSSYEKN